MELNSELSDGEKTAKEFQLRGEALHEGLPHRGRPQGARQGRALAGRRRRPCRRRPQDSDEGQEDRQERNQPPAARHLALQHEGRNT